MLSNLPPEARRLWEEVYAANKEKLGEEAAAKVAWSVVKRKYKKKGDKWVARKGLFDIYVPVSIKKSVDESSKEKYIVYGVASTTDKDRTGDVISEYALKKMEFDSSSKKIPVFSNHDHSWENTMGYISRSFVADNKLNVEIALEDPSVNDKVALLISKQEHGTPIGLSIGGRVLKSHFEKNGDSSVRVIDDLELLELSFVGIPANENGSVLSYIVKSLDDGDVIMSEENVKEEVVQKQEPVVEQAVVKEQPKDEQFISRKEFELLKQNLIKDLATELANSLKSSKKAIVDVVEKDNEIAVKDSSDKLEEALRKRI